MNKTSSPTIVAVVQPCETPSVPKPAHAQVENGIVSVDPDRMGCRYCEWNCPYGAPFDPERKADQCDCATILSKACPRPASRPALPRAGLRQARRTTRYGEQARHRSPLPGAGRNSARPHFICAPNRHFQMRRGYHRRAAREHISNPRGFSHVRFGSRHLHLLGQAAADASVASSAVPPTRRGPEA